MKKILIICDIFPPAFGPRMGYLCKYLKDFGWEPTVLAETVPENTFEFLSGHCTTHFVSFYDKSGKAGWLWKFIKNFLFDIKEKKMYRKACELLKKENYLLILSSTYRTFPLPTAAKVAREFNLPLFVDLRDIVEQYTGREYITTPLPTLLGIDKIITSIFKRKLIYQRNKIVEQAAIVTTISPWHVEFLKTYNSNIHLIYNGFDPEVFYPVHTSAKQFRITYTGRLLSTEMRDPSLLFEALSILNKREVIHPETCRVEWYVDRYSEKIIKEMAICQKIDQFMDYKGYIPASDIPGVLQQSSILLLLTNKSTGKGPKGVMTTKFFESLAVEKPILCVRSDESYLEAAIRETNAGLAAKEVKEVTKFLEFQYNEWMNNGYTQALVNKEVIKKYSRKEQAGQFSALFNTLTEQN